MSPRDYQARMAYEWKHKWNKRHKIVMLGHSGRKNLMGSGWKETWAKDERHNRIWHIS